MSERICACVLAFCASSGACWFLLCLHAALTTTTSFARKSKAKRFGQQCRARVVNCPSSTAPVICICVCMRICGRVKDGRFFTSFFLSLLAMCECVKWLLVHDRTNGVRPSTRVM